MRKTFNLFLVILLVFSFLSFSVAKVLKADGDYRIYFDDSEDLLSDTEEKMLQEEMKKITEYGNVGFVSVSQYQDTGSYAKQLYRELFDTQSGFLFVIDMGRRNIWIHSNGAIYRVINKPYANTITDNVYRYASRGEYYECAYHVYEQALTLLEGGRISQPMKYISNLLIALVSALLINFYVLIFSRKNPPVMSSETAHGAMTSAVGVNILSLDLIRSKRSRHVESSGGGGFSGGGFSGGGGGGGFSGCGGGGGGGGGGHSF
ncbi:MAG: TPM domain-containing protein [Erysipelotrichaceae bacterium]|nr:TPM domain-containing protein [Erysipelotrichaceae bacterium]